MDQSDMLQMEDSCGIESSQFIGDDISLEDLTESLCPVEDESITVERSRIKGKAHTSVGFEDFINEDDSNVQYESMNSEQCNHNISELTSDDVKFDKLMSTLGIHKAANEIERVDLIGRVFRSLEDADFFFNHYAKLTGFSVRKGHMRRRTNGKLMLREWMCSRQGYRDDKFNKMLNRKREARAVTRVGCQVLFRVLQKKYGSDWIVKEFRTKHSHKLVHSTHIQFLRSNRVVSGGDLDVARKMKSAGIRTCQIMTFFAEQCGGYEKMRYIIKDLYNHIGSFEDVKLTDVDASRAMGYLEHKADHDGGFFAKYSYDNCGRLGNVVWADSKCQSDYNAYGHAIAFDTTYRTNGYGKPLLIWIGINRHYKTTVLGFAILINETLETYKWVIEAFLECMKGVTPKTVVTDGDLAIRAAIADLMPNCRHRLCSWHIQRKASINVKDPSFMPRMKKMMYRYYSNEEFDEEWTRMVNDFGLESNGWIQQMYARRKTWAETYLRGLFFVGMTTTQRSEGINALLKKRLTDKLNLSEFMRSIDMAMSWLRHIEAKDDFDTLNSKPIIGLSNMKEIEAQAADVYCRRIFFKVRKQIVKEGKYIVASNMLQKDGICYEMTKYGEKKCKRKVVYNSDMNIYNCECNYFPTFGLPCSHVFAVIKYRHVKKIPESMIVSQWTMHPNVSSMKESDYAPRCKYTCSEQSTRSGVLQRWTTDISFLGGKNSHVFGLAIGELARVHRLILKELQTGHDTINESSQFIPSKHKVRNPLWTKTKGTSDSKRGPAGGKRKCSQCNKYGHNKTTCSNRTSQQTKRCHVDTDLEEDNGQDSNDYLYDQDVVVEEEDVGEEADCTVLNVGGGIFSANEVDKTKFGEEATVHEAKSEHFDYKISDHEYEAWWGTPLGN